MHFPDIVDNAPILTQRNGNARSIILSIKIHEIRRSIVPAVFCHVTVTPAKVKDSLSSALRNLNEFVDVSSRICFTFKCFFIHRSTIVVVNATQLPGRFTCQKQNIAVLGNQANILVIADFAVDIVFQLFTPRLGVVAK